LAQADWWIRRPFSWRCGAMVGVATQTQDRPLAAKLSRDLDARRLENAAWRLWQKEQREKQRARSGGTVASRDRHDGSGECCSGSGNDSSEERADLAGVNLKSLQDAIGDRLDFTGVRFPQGQLGCDYDDLPTFPIRPNFAGFKNQLQPASECVVFDGCPEDPYHPSNTPIYQTATFVQPSASEFGAYDYTRSGNPTRTALEKHVAMLEQAAAAFAFASGMAALHTVMRLLRCGDEILVNEDIYGGMHRLVTQDCIHSGIIVSFVDTTDLPSVERAITPRTKLIHTESPSNPRMRITDLRALAAIAHRHGVLLSVDSTMMPPVICKPVTLGVDIVVHSATKFFSGHADCTGGLVCVRDPEMAQRVAFLQNAEGTALAPFECFLFLRGIKTMFLRVERMQENAQKVANFLLRKRPYIKEVFFPGVARDGGSQSLAIHHSQCRGPGSIISFTAGSVEFSCRLLNACRIFKTTVSFGSVNSLGEMPCTMSHASIPSEKRSLPGDLVRLSVGIEDVQDLLSDLEHALWVAAEGRALQADDAFDSRFEDLPVVPNLCPGSSEDDASTRAPTTTKESTEVESSEEGPAPIARGGDVALATAAPGERERDAKSTAAATAVVVAAAGLALLLSWRAAARR